MRNLIVIALALFALGAVTCLAEAPAGKAAARPQWEYLALGEKTVVEMGKKDVTAGLNKLGDDGWELVAVVQTQGQQRDNPAGFRSYYFKRAKMEVAKTATKAAPPAPEAARPELRLIRLRFARASDLADTLQAVFHGSPIQIVPELRTNTLILRGTAQQIEEAQVLVRELDIDGGQKKATPD